ncbi:disease resistance protein RGA2-like [Miscanthus floridulus]|uniref:disease resistance protein RGA2-like n=1 Tax=Miscanthus floridulus TaxID=154761 RepID=UPI003458AF80
MEAITSAATDDLIGRAISFLVDKLTNRECMEDKLQRLQLLLLRVRTVIEEADARCITNSGMLMQLKQLSESMYRGYYVLENFKYRPVIESDEQKVSSSRTLVSSIIGASIKRFRMSNSTTSRSSTADDVVGALRSLETMVDTMKEFVILIGGCERVCRNPYDTYLYIDNFMFGRHVEKQQVINTLLQKHLNNQGAPAILAIIGAHKVGKRTLVSHVCNTDKIRSHFSSMLHISGHAISSIEHDKFPCVRTLVVIEFTSDVNDDDWMKFYSCASRMGEGSKVVVISRLEKIARFATVKPIHLKLLSQEEFSYLFKVLAFGSTNPEDNPQLSSIGNELATLMQRSFIMGNILADLTNRECMEDKLQRLQLLLLRVCMVVDEADGRCITNSGMLMQLKLLSESMYQGYYVLENFKYRPITESDEQRGALNVCAAIPTESLHEFY